MVEVAKVGSITKAAANLFMGQPNLSKAIKEVENEVGITIFNRSARGVFPTEKGAEFLEYARAIMVQMDKIESLYTPYPHGSVSFGVSVPRASYTSFAFTEFINTLDKKVHINIDFRETGSLEAINNVCCGLSSFAVIRYDSEYEEYFVSLLEEKSLRSEVILSSHYLLLISSSDELALADKITAESLSGYTEIVHGDYCVPYLSNEYTRKNESIQTRGRICVYERGSQFDLLCNTDKTFMWISPLPEEILEKNHLVQRKCANAKRCYKDVLISPVSGKACEYTQSLAEHLRRSAQAAAKAAENAV